MSDHEQDRIYSSLAAGLAEEQADAKLKRSVLDRVSAAIDPPPQGGTTVRASETDWQYVTPTVAVKVLLKDESIDMQTALWRLDPGGVIPGHNHAKNEECLVLEGKFHVGDHILNPGDFHVMEAGSAHPELSAPEGCLLYIRQAITRDLSWMAQG